MKQTIRPMRRGSDFATLDQVFNIAGNMLQGEMGPVSLEMQKVWNRLARIEQTLGLEPNPDWMPPVITDPEAEARQDSPC